MMTWTTDVVIPVYRPGEKFELLLERLLGQSVPVRRIILINTDEKLWDQEHFAALEKQWGLSPEEAEKKFSLTHIAPEKFDHGGTRSLGMRMSDADMVVMMTQDAVPRDRFLIAQLHAALWQSEDIAVAYGRQLPARDCNLMERYSRQFNYPETGRVKSLADLPQLGIKTYFCSDVCAAYRRDIWERVGGFITKTIFNEDMIFAASAMKAGYRVAYAAQAQVIHSHNYTVLQQLRRSFDLAVSQADHPEVFADVPAEGEGIRMVKSTARWLLSQGHPELVPVLAVQSAARYLGYRLGKSYRRLPMRLIRRLTMSPCYWLRDEVKDGGMDA